MIKNSSMPQSSVIPELGYPDVREAADWLVRVFGFTVRLRIGGHRIQLTYGTGDLVVVEGAMSTQSSLSHRVMVRVTDVDAHYRQAKSAGATIAAEPQTYPYGERQYSAMDLNGHAWTFSQSVADVDPRSWGGVFGDEV